jgi:ABC-type sulfate/molybdate transport systems ATPase subunit
MDRLELPAGRRCCLIGPTGSGKTTLLKAIAGLIGPERGRIAWGDQLWAEGRPLIPPHRRGIAMVSQELALWPHLSVYSHLKLVLGRGADRQRMEQLLAEVRLDGQERKYPRQLSGGQRQQLALARALAADPRLLLLDEPFAHADAELRRELLGIVLRRLAEQQITALYVTHSWDDVRRFAEEVILLQQGKLAFQGSPQELEQQHAQGLAEFMIVDSGPRRLTDDT